MFAKCQACFAAIYKSNNCPIGGRGPYKKVQRGAPCVAQKINLQLKRSQSGFVG